MTEKNWHEDEAFWEEALPILFPQQRIEFAEQEVEALIALTGLEAETPVLDLCCGVGRHTLAFARRGFPVTGVDIAAKYLARAQAQAKEEGLQATFLQGDMRSFARRETYGIVLNLFTSFGFFADPADDRRVVENIYSSLQRGGLLVLEMLGKEILAGMFRERDWYDAGDFKILEARELKDDWSWIETKWIIIKGDRIKELELSHRLYSAAELKGLLAGCGFGDIKAFGDLNGSPYDHKARRLVVLARKD